jgi:hypothetical protein
MSYNLMLRASGDKTKINILTLVLSENKFLNETNNHNTPPPPLYIGDMYAEDHWTGYKLFENIKINSFWNSGVRVVQPALRPEPQMIF